MTDTATLGRRTLLAGAATLPALATRRARAQAAMPTLRIGVLTDLSGQYRDNSGPTSVLAARQAVEDFRPEQHGFAVQIVSADHGQKPDIGSAIARQWIDRDGVDAVADINNTAVALAVNTVVAERDKVSLISGAASSEITGKYCSPNTVHWAGDSWAGPHAVGSAVLRQGGTSWFLIAADYTFGHSLESEITKVVGAAGGQVKGHIAYPFPGTTDFSSYLVQAQASGAKVLGLCCTGGDMENCVKQAHEFGLVSGGMTLAALLGFVTEVHSMGLEIAQGLLVSEPFYWDLNERTRAFTRRFVPKTPTNYPSGLHAACYGAVTHYMRTAAQAGVAEVKASGRAAVAAMKRLPTDDDCFGVNSIRSDGRFVCPMYLFRAKAPAASHGPWDVYDLLATIPAAEAFRPLADGACAMKA